MHYRVVHNDLVTRWQSGYVVKHVVDLERSVRLVLFVNSDTNESIFFIVLAAIKFHVRV